MSCIYGCEVDCVVPVINSG